MSVEVMSLLPTTLEADKTVVTRGEEITFTVKAPPLTRVIIYMSGNGYENVPITTLRVRLISSVMGVTFPYDTSAIKPGTFQFVANSRRIRKIGSSDPVVVVIK